MAAGSVHPGDSEPKWQDDKNDYMDRNIIFLNNVKDLSIVDDLPRKNMFVSIICYKGRLQLKINTIPHTVQTSQILSCHPNDALSDTMISPDFQGAILCLSSEIVLQLFGENDIWSYFSRFSASPIVHISKESLRMLKIYDEAFHTKIKTEQSVFKRETLSLIIKCLLYEIMENMNTYMPSLTKGLSQKDILFKHFIDLLSGSTVKPRSVSWYAERLCITPKYLSTVCKQVTNKTAFEWINEYVAVDICHLLKNTNKSIKEIVDILKFPNASFFGSYCRKRFGMSPMEYRKHLRIPSPQKTEDKR